MSSEGQRSATPRASHDDSAERSDTSRSLAPDRTGRSGQQAAHRGIYWPPTDVLRKERPTEVPLPTGKPASIALSQTTADELQEKKSYSEGSRALPPPPSSVVPPNMLGSSANVSSAALPRDAVVGSDQGSGSVISRDVGNIIPRDSPSEKRISESPHVSSSTDSWRPSLGEGSRGLPPPPSSVVPPSMFGSSANVSSTALPRDVVVGSDQGSGSVISRDVGNRIPRDSPSEKRSIESPHVSSSTDSWRPLLGEGSRTLPPPPSSVVPPSMLGSFANVSSTALPRDVVVGSDQGSGSVISRDVGNSIPRDSSSEKRSIESPHVSSSSTDSWRPSLGEGSRGLPPPPSSTVFTNKQEILLVAPPTYEVQSSTVFSHEPSGVPFAQHGSSQPRASTGISYDIIRTSTSSGQLQQKSDVPVEQYYNLDHQSHNGMSHVDEMKPSHTNPTSKIYKSLNQGTSNDMTRSVWNPPPLNQNLDPEGPPPPVHDATGNMAPRGDAPLKTPLPLHSRVKSKSHGGKIDPSQVIPFRKITLWYV